MGVLTVVLTHVIARSSGVFEDALSSDHAAPRRRESYTRFARVERLVTEAEVEAVFGAAAQTLEAAHPTLVPETTPAPRKRRRRASSSSRTMATCAS